MNFIRISLTLFLVWICSAASAAEKATGKPEFNLVIRDHKFEPTELTVAAGQKVVLLVDNQDATPEEFESHQLNREKIIPGKTKVKIFVGPLDPGKYPFFGDFHEASAQGALIVK